MRLKTLRPFNGISLVGRWSITWPSEALVGCSSGVSAVTSIVWLTAPSSMGTSMRTACWTCTTTDSRLKCLKPVLSASRVYAPGFKLTKEYSPSGPVVKVCLALVATLVKVTCTSATAAPEASITVPEIEPKVDCAASGELRSMAARQNTNATASTRKKRSDDLIMILFLPTERRARPTHPEIEKGTRLRG